MNAEKLRLDKIIFECNQHIEKLNKAHEKLKSKFPLTEEGYKNLDDDNISYLDQYLYRFSKLQDSVGQKLFKAVLDGKKEETANKAFIDIVNRLEQLEYLQDVEGWFDLRNTRNQLAYEYEDDTEELLVIINRIFAQKEKLASYYFTIIEKLGRSKANPLR